MIINALLLSILLLFLIVWIPVRRVENDKKIFLGFYYDEIGKKVILPAWVMVLYALFFVCFSGMYLYLWIAEMHTPDYRAENFIIDFLLFGGIVNFVTIPLVKKSFEKLVELSVKK